jgi:hypothetical protein
MVSALLMAWPEAAQATPAAGAPTDSGRDIVSSASGSHHPGWSGGPRWDWSRPKQVSTDDPAKFVALSCGSPTFCMAADEGGFYYRWDGRTWSLASHFGFTDPYNQNRLEYLSCASPTFCASVEVYWSEVGPQLGNVVFWDKGGRRESQYIPDWSAGEVSCTSATNCVAGAGFTSDGWARWDGKSWEVHQTPGFWSPRNLTCASATLCLAMGGPGVVRYNGTSWVDEEALPPSTLSCSSVALCLAIGSDGVTRRFTGSAWVVAPTPPVGGSLSCASPTYCVDFGQSSYSVYDGSTWSDPVALPPAPITGLLSCARASFCAAAASNQLAQFKRGHWTRPTTVGDDPAPLTHVSCATRRSCVGVGAFDAHRFSPGGQISWTKLDLITEPFSDITGISCAATTFCVATTGQWAVAETNVVHVFDGSGWHAISSSDVRRHPQAVSCVSARFCLAVGSGQDGGGETTFFDGVSWRWFPSSLLTRVSCISATFCLATGEAGGRTVSSVFNGTTWSTPAPFGDATGAAPVSLSCASTRYCVAIDAGGRAATYRGTRWSAFADVAAGGPLVAVSCHGPATCLAVSSTGNVVQHLGTHWSRPRHLKGLTTPVDISCPSARACVVVDNSGQGVFGRIR